ncbi:MAG: hypothetical protein NC097_05560 [Clostridium sp.]|nr:hypothetical protein [Prevotella sp.]MCM1429244.1 hypothetical protein [Clostridium sp.]MCM1475723.1 hypothetical protein [Muribaculaceae bacterium]
MKQKVFFKIIYLWAILLTSVLPCVAQSKIDAIKQNVAKMAADFPIELPSIGEFSTLVYNEASNQVVFTIMLSNPVAIESIQVTPDGMRKSFGNMLGKSLRKMSQDLYDGDVSVSFRFFDYDGKLLANIVYTKEDLDTILHMQQGSEKETIRHLIESQMKEMREQLPKELGNGLYLIDCGYDNGKVIYTYSVDETIANMNQFSKENMINSSKEDPFMSQLYSRYKTGVVTLVYKYIGNNSRREIIFTITPEEM